MTDKKTPAKTGQEQATRTAQGRFKSGQSGNPKGRSAGSRNKATQAILSLLDGQAEAITQKLIDAALDGDLSAAKIIIDKLAPNSREHPLPPLELPSVSNTADMPKLTQRLLEAVGNGELLPSQAQALASLVGAHGKALELHELEQRISTLEAAHNE